MNHNEVQPYCSQLKTMGIGYDDAPSDESILLKPLKLNDYVPLLAAGLRVRVAVGNLL